MVCDDRSMTTFLVFLRAINLGARRKFPKADIIAASEAAGFTGVLTHIASGNVRVDTPLRSRAKVEAALEAAYAADRGFEVPCIAFGVPEFLEIAATGAELSAARPGLARHYVYLLKEELGPALRADVEATAGEDGEAVVAGRAVHVLLGPGYVAGNVDPLGVAKRLPVATNRNLNVVTTLAGKWCAPGS